MRSFPRLPPRTDKGPRRLLPRGIAPPPSPATHARVGTGRTATSATPPTSPQTSNSTRRLRMRSRVAPPRTCLTRVVFDGLDYLGRPCGQRTFVVSHADHPRRDLR